MQMEHGLLRSHFFLRCWQLTHASTFAAALRGPDEVTDDIVKRHSLELNSKRPEGNLP